MAEVKSLPGGKSITLSGELRMKDFRKWLKAEAENHMEVTYGYLAKLVEKWDLTGEDGQALDPRDPESYDELTLSEFKAVSGAVGEYVKAATDVKN